MTTPPAKPPAPVSVILPVFNESHTLPPLLTQIRTLLPHAEILAVDDGSTLPVQVPEGVSVIRHPVNLGNGAAIKTGARHAKGEVLVFMDTDGQHDPADIPRLLAKLEEGYDMVVGARGRGSQASIGRGLANRLYNRLARYMTGQEVLDLTSGFRAARADKFLEYLYLLPNSFSYPTTITMAFMRSAYPVAYVPITARKRIGKSHLRPLRDGLRFLLIIFKIATLYAPFKLFGPVAFAFWGMGLGWYAITYASTGRFTNMSALLLSAGVIVFLIGLISEQITNLTYKRVG